MPNARTAGVLCCVLLAAELVALGPTLAERGPSTQEEREQAVRYVRLLEGAPAEEEAKEALVWLTKWLAEIPDITVHFCLDLIGTEKERKGIPARLKTQQPYSSAAYSIENPSSEPDSLEVFLAGVEGTLRAYEAMRDAGQVQPHPHLEELLDKKRTSDLQRHVAKRMKKC